MHFEDSGIEMANEFRIKNGVSIGAIPVINSDGEWVGPTIRTPYVLVTNTYTAVNGDRLYADTGGGAFTISLPASPSVGDTVKIAGPAAWIPTT